MVQLLLLGSYRPFANPPFRSHVVILIYPQIQKLSFTNTVWEVYMNTCDMSISCTGFFKPLLTQRHNAWTLRRLEAFLGNFSSWETRLLLHGRDVPLNIFRSNWIAKRRIYTYNTRFFTCYIVLRNTQKHLFPKLITTYMLEETYMQPPSNKMYRVNLCKSHRSALKATKKWTSMNLTDLHDGHSWASRWVICTCGSQASTEKILKCWAIEGRGFPTNNHPSGGVLGFWLQVTSLVVGERIWSKHHSIQLTNHTNQCPSPLIQVLLPAIYWISH